MAAPPPAVAATTLAVGLGAALALSNVGRKSCITLAALLTAAHSVDAEHFIRILLVELSHRWKRRRGSSFAEVLEPHRAVHICWPIDLDGNSHMNNAKYVRLLNYSRRAFWLQNGMWAACARRSPPANMVVTASALRFRRQIGCFERFRVVTRILHWDDAAFYLEHQFESITDGFVLATCLVKYRPVSIGAGSVSPSDLLEACAAGEAAGKDAEACFVSPPPTPELAALIEYDRQASRSLRPPQLEA